MKQRATDFQLDKEQAVLVVIDVQERLIPAMNKKVYEQVKSNIELLVAGARQLGIPVVTTEQYPRGLGHTVAELAKICGETLIEKISFGCCGEPKFNAELQRIGRKQVIVVGMEAHVCVYQTVLGLLEAGYAVHLVRDAICSRKKENFQAAVANTGAAGAVISTTEMALFQMLKEAGTPEFKAISKLLK
ncbi:MAG: isochorismatase family protein [Desulfuromonadales bacterium]|nr:isochorismatase family protein [Desulfuromonadales bacterium]